ncbi:hypothetical protein CEXT_343561 [Caerostris extrusa]|uniref:Uncharacterized protein n=1 Tax=Caerostris extrusa TaxID=172846 RepID=A0AAV4YCD1_CAEEX|nr:hypothetical protein CEXT_343561 [Caerostris extrusa]
MEAILQAAFCTYCICVPFESLSFYNACKLTEMQCGKDRHLFPSLRMLFLELAYLLHSRYACVERERIGSADACWCDEYFRRRFQYDANGRGNGPSQDHMEVTSRWKWIAMQKEKQDRKVSPEEACRQINTAYKEMDVIDSIVAQSKRSDLQQNYVQITETLLQKRKFLTEWESQTLEEIAGQLHTGIPIPYVLNKIANSASKTMRRAATKAQDLRNIAKSYGVNMSVNQK